jgi:hypothetical protein
MSLLYSEKKPGDVPPKHLIVDLVACLFDLYRLSDNASPAQLGVELESGSSVVSEVKIHSKQILVFPEPTFSANNPPAEGPQARGVPGGHNRISGFVLSLLQSSLPESQSAPKTADNSRVNSDSRIMAPASELPPPKLEMHDFLTVAHKPRIYHIYLKELSQACWDFFW